MSGPRTRGTARAALRHGWSGPVGLALVGLFAAVAVAGAFAGDPLAMDHEALAPPSVQHPFGTDHLGRDLLARTGHGAGTSILVAVGSVLLATGLALPIGLVAAWYRNRVADRLLVQAVEVAQVVPPFILVVIILGLTSGPTPQLAGLALTPTVRLVAALAIGFVPYMTRVVRSAAAAELELDHVEGLLLIGVPRREILWREVLPNVVPAVVVQFLLAVSIAVFAEGGLSYLGLGIPAPEPTLGNLIAEAGSQLLDDAWWYALLPGLILVVGITGLNLLADAATELAVGGPRPPSEVAPLVDPVGAAEDTAERPPAPPATRNELTEALP